MIQIEAQELGYFPDCNAPIWHKKHHHYFLTNFTQESGEAFGTILNEKKQKAFASKLTRF